MSQESNSNHLYEPEFSIKKVLFDRKQDLIYLTRFKKQFGLAIVIGIIGGALSAWLWPVSYTAKTSFIIEDSKASGGSLLAGLAGQFGLGDMAGALGGATGVLAGDNVMALLKSQNMMEKTLLSPYADSSGITLADKFAESEKLKKSWKKFNVNGKPVMFTEDRSKYNRVQDSLFQIILKKVDEEHLSVFKPDKKLAFFELNMTSRDEKLAQLFSARVISEASDFYIKTKTRTQRINVSRLQARADSLVRILNRKTYSTSAANQIMLDANPAFPTSSVGAEVQQRDKIVLQTIYGEIVKNLEISKTMLIQETPTFQLVDTPHIPLKKNQLKYPKGIVLGVALAMLLCGIYLLMRRKENVM